MNENRIRSLPLLAGAGLIVASFVLYLSTLAPTLTWGWNSTGVDGGELLAAANTLGIPHPPGYPTYTLLLKSFATVVPVGDFAYRGNLLSAVLASASVLTVYWVSLRFCRHLKPDAPEALVVIGAALGSAVFATSPLFWSQAVITEVYALNALFVGALLLVASHLALSSPGGPSHGAPHTAQKLALFGLLLGIGLGNHLTLLAVAIPLLYWLWSALGWRTLASPWMIAALVLGLAVYAYLPVRAAQDPAINWGNADTLSGLAWMVSGGPYQEYLFSVPAESIRERLVSWLDLVFSQFNPLGLFLGLIAVAPLRTRAPRFFISTLASIILLSTYSLSYNTVDFEVLMIPAFLLFSVWVGAGFFWIMAAWTRDFVESREGPSLRPLRLLASHQVLALSILGFVLLPGLAVVLNYGSQNLRGDRSAYDYAAGVLEAVPDGSVVLSGREESAFSLWYMRYVESPERDVATIATPLLQFDWYLRDVHRMFPQRVPQMESIDVVEAVRRIVEHNDGGRGVFFTEGFPSDAFELSRVGSIYKASVK